MQKELAEFKTGVQKELVMIKSIIQTGTEDGEPVYNPIFQASTTVISGELLLQYKTSDLWESITYPNEYVKVQNGQIIQRYDIARNIFVDFDYRNYSASVKFTVDPADKTFKQRRDEIERLLPGDFEEVKDKARQFQDLAFEKISVNFSEKNTPLFVDRDCRDVFISNCSNLYLQPSAEFINVSLQNVQNLVVQGLVNSNLKNIKGGIIREGSNLDLTNLDYVRIERNVCDFGNITYQGDENKQDQYLIVKNNSCNGSRLKLKGSVSIGHNSLNYSNVYIKNNINFTCLVDEDESGAANYACVDICSEEGSSVVLNPGCSNYGALKCPHNSLKENGVVYYKNSQNKNEVYSQSLVLNPMCRCFYTKLQFKDIEIVDPTQEIIQNLTNNGPFNEEYILHNLRLNKIMFDGQNFYGNACLNINTQTFSNWGPINGVATKMSQITATLLNDETSHNIYFYAQENYINLQDDTLQVNPYTISLLDLNLDNRNFNIQNIYINGRSILNNWSSGAVIKIHMQNTSGLNIKLYADTPEQACKIDTLEIDGTSAFDLQTFDIDIGEQSKENLHTLSLPLNLVNKITNKKKMFYKAPNIQQNLIQMFDTIEESMFEESTIYVSEDSVNLTCQLIKKKGFKNAKFITGERESPYTINFSNCEIEEEGFYGVQSSSVNLAGEFMATGPSVFEKMQNINVAQLYDCSFFTQNNSFKDSGLKIIELYPGYDIPSDFENYNLGEGVFEGTQIATYNINTKKLGNKWFKNCKQLTRFETIVIVIPDECFMGCETLNYVKANGISEFGKSSFEGCSALQILQTEIATMFYQNCFKQSGLLAVGIRSQAILQEGILQGNTNPQCHVIFNKTFYDTGFEHFTGTIHCKQSVYDSMAQTFAGQDKYANITLDPSL